MTPDAYREVLVKGLIDAGVPEHLHAGLCEYLAARRPTGSFLQAVLENDLSDAARRADDLSAYTLVNLVRFLDWYAPARAWGSPTIVSAWLADPVSPVAVLE